MSSSCRFCPELAGETRASEFHEMTQNRIASRFIRQSDNFAVFPALGPIHAGHLLLCTKRHWLCMAQIDPVLFGELEQILTATRLQLGKLYGPDVLVYEHGQMSPANRCGACVDHAHLHLVATSRGVDVPIRDRLRHAYPERNVQLLKDLVSVTPQDHGYLFFQDHGGNRFLYDAPLVPSQYLRRIVCDAMGLSDRWDWRRNVDVDTIDGSIAAMRAVIDRMGNGWAVHGGVTR